MLTMCWKPGSAAEATKWKVMIKPATKASAAMITAPSAVRSVELDVRLETAGLHPKPIDDIRTVLRGRDALSDGLAARPARPPMAFGAPRRLQAAAALRIQDAQAPWRTKVCRGRTHKHATLGR
mmetsp:Transcript_32262/g.94350  ORF Transcript_32262/g.94350 Transcript_32262/m.94350 type:complete len:124 (+) Transcript_32262:402-773(+)